MFARRPTSEWDHGFNSMEEKTRKLWIDQDRHTGDRLRLFRAISEYTAAKKVLYPGCFVDVAPSFSFRNVTFVDIDSRAQQFFADPDGVREIIASQAGAPGSPEFRFIHADYTEDLGLRGQSFDLLISLYAGFVSEHCSRYLRPGGTLLVNPSHGDAAMASIDPAFRLTGLVISRGGEYRVKTGDLGQYLVPKKPGTITAESLHESGRGVAYTRPAFAYLFEFSPD